MSQSFGFRESRVQRFTFAAEPDTYAVRESSYRIRGLGFRVEGLGLVQDIVMPWLAALKAWSLE